MLTGEPSVFTRLREASIDGRVCNTLHRYSHELHPDRHAIMTYKQLVAYDLQQLIWDGSLRDYHIDVNMVGETQDECTVTVTYTKWPGLHYAQQTVRLLVHNRQHVADLTPMV